MAARRRLMVAGLKPCAAWLATKRSISRKVTASGGRSPTKVANWRRS